MRVISRNWMKALSACAAMTVSEAIYAAECPSENVLASVHYLNSDELRRAFSNVVVDRDFDAPSTTAPLTEIFFSNGDHHIAYDGAISRGRFRIENDALVTSGSDEKAERMIKVFKFEEMTFFRDIGAVSACWRVKMVAR